MPRYSGVLASLFLIVLCVGFNIKRYPVVSEMLQSDSRETANVALKVSEVKPATDAAETSYHSYASSSSSSSRSNSMGMARQPIPSPQVTDSTLVTGTTPATGTTSATATVSARREDIRSGDSRPEMSYSSSSSASLSSDTRSKPSYIPDDGMETYRPESTTSFAGKNDDYLFGNDDGDSPKAAYMSSMSSGYQPSRFGNVSSEEMADKNRSKDISGDIDDDYYADGRNEATIRNKDVVAGGLNASDSKAMDKTVRGAVTTGENTTTSTTSTSMPQTVQKPGSYQADDALPGYTSEYQRSGQSVMPAVMPAQGTPASAAAIAGSSGNKENVSSAQEKFGIKKETPFVLQNDATASKASQRGNSEYVPPTMLPVTEDRETRGFLMPTAETGTVLTLVMPIPEM